MLVSALLSWRSGSPAITASNLAMCSKGACVIGTGALLTKGVHSSIQSEGHRRLGIVPIDLPRIGL